MPSTSPDNIYYPDGLSPLSLETIIQMVAGSVQDALDGRQVKGYLWADDTEKDAQTGMGTGDMGFKLDDRTRWEFDGTTWQRVIRVTSGTTAPAWANDGDVWVVKAV